MRRVFCLLVVICLISPPVIHPTSVGQDQNAAESVAPESSTSLQIQKQLEGDFDAEKIVAANTWVASTGAVDWLGPLAPVAMSPFFGIACLSGLSLWGPEWVSNNALLGSSGPLKNEWLFAVFLLLTVLTSVPRLTKVSKPFAQAVDRLETYAVIVILLAIKLIATIESPGDQPVAMIQMGIISFTLDTFLGIAMVINVLVINSVKFFFEFLVWLTPVPLLDAVFEVCNKTLCMALMAVYAFSPTLATVINLCMLVFAAIILRWISRRVRFYRTMILDPVIAKLWSGFGKAKRPELIVFPRDVIGPFKPKSRLRLQRKAGNDGWLLKEATWWLPAKEHELSADCQPEICHGWVMHAVTIRHGDTRSELIFSRRYDNQSLAELADQIGLQLPAQVASDAESKSHDHFAGEFA